MVGRLHFSVVGEYRRAAGILSSPRPRVALNVQLVRGCIALTVEEVGEVLLALLIVADDFGATDVGPPHAPVRGVEDEKPSGIHS